VTTPALDADYRLEIADLLVRYATGIDRRDRPVPPFTADATRTTATSVWNGVDELTASMMRHEGAGHTLHRSANRRSSGTAPPAQRRRHRDGRRQPVGSAG
jgi:hypothetical protein